MILAVDPGSRVSGWAIVNSAGRVLDSGAVSASRTGLLAERVAMVVINAGVAAEGWGLQLVIERATPQTTRDRETGKRRYTDSWGPGLAAGIFVAYWVGLLAQVPRPPEPRMVMVRGWRRAMLGRCRGREHAKRLAVQRAREELLRSGRTFSAPSHQQVDEAEAICIGVYAAMGES